MPLKQKEIFVYVVCILSWLSVPPITTSVHDFYLKNKVATFATIPCMESPILQARHRERPHLNETRLSLRGGCGPFPAVPVPPRSFFEGLYGPLWKNAVLDRPEDGLYENLRAGMPVDGPPHEALATSATRLDRSSERFLRSVRLPSSITNRSLDELNYQDRAKIEILRSAKLLQQQGLIRQHIRRTKQDKVIWRLKAALLAPARIIKHCLASLLRCAGLLPTNRRRLKYIRDLIIDPPPPPAHDLPVSGPLGLLLLERNGEG